MSPVLEPTAGSPHWLKACTFTAMPPFLSFYFIFYFSLGGFRSIRWLGFVWSRGGSLICHPHSSRWHSTVQGWRLKTALCYPYVISMAYTLMAIENVFRVYIAWCKQERGWENLRQSPVLYTKSCTCNQFLFCKKVLSKIRIFLT